MEPKTLLGKILKEEKEKEYWNGKIGQTKDNRNGRVGLERKRWKQKGQKLNIEDRKYTEEQKRKQRRDKAICRKENYKRKNKIGRESTKTIVMKEN